MLIDRHRNRGGLLRNKQKSQPSEQRSILQETDVLFLLYQLLKPIAAPTPQFVTEQILLTEAAEIEEATQDAERTYSQVEQFRASSVKKIAERVSRFFFFFFTKKVAEIGCRAQGRH